MDGDPVLAGAPVGDAEVVGVGAAAVDMAEEEIGVAEREDDGDAAEEVPEERDLLFATMTTNCAAWLTYGEEK